MNLQISPEAILNCLLVKEGVRPAYLYQQFQPPNTKSLKSLQLKGKMIKKLFPDLNLTEPEIKGILISLKKQKWPIDDEKMGEALGYPCAKGFSTLNKDKTRYSMRIYVATNNGRFEIMANSCQNKKMLPAFKHIANEAKKVFVRNEDFLATFDLIVLDVKVSVEKIVSINSIMNKLIQNKALDETDKAETSNWIWNEIGEETQTYFDTRFQFNNPKHIGILTDILLNSKISVMSPFYPLQLQPKHDEVTKLLRERDLELARILKLTETN